MPANDTTILIVEDKEDLADGYASVLSTEYDTRTAYTGEEAMDVIDDSVDIVFLDRRMPGLTGREVLERIRESGYECRVAMVTAVTPDFDIVEMGFDDYLVKPVEVDDLFKAVERLRVLGEQSPEVRNYIAESIKQASLESTMDEVDLAEAEEYTQLTEQVSEMSVELGDISAEMSEDEFELILEMIIRNIQPASGQDAAGD
jgi:DNA-binding response OmpR family regulator